MKSQWRKYLSQPGNIRLVAIEAGDLVAQLCKQQKLAGPAQKGYAEAVIGALLIASAHKSNESINLNAQGSGLYKQSIIDASPEGKVRGFLIEQEDPLLRTYGAEGHNGPWGSGVLSILHTKNYEGKHPYTGMVPISTGYLDQAINEYYRDSEQLASLIGLSVAYEEGAVLSARGALVQALGGATAEELEALTHLDLTQMQSLAALSGDFDAFAIEASRLLGNRNFQTVETAPLTAFCTCSQERIERALLLTGFEATLEALADDEVMTITCDFCRTEYKLAAERVHALFIRDPSQLQ
jgi:molecular chaperone Hsp33